MILVRRARATDALEIGAVHATAWRSAYPGLLSETYLATLDGARLGHTYQRAIADRRDGHAVFVAIAEAADRTDGGTGPAVIGFVSGGRARRPALGGGEVETLYLLDDYRDRGVGRRLMRAMAAHLSAVGCGSAMLWVLRDNPTRWFYQHLGGRPVAREVINFAGKPVEQVAFSWDPIDALLAATAPAREA